MPPVAQTNLQLYNQMFDQGRPEQELALVRRADDLTALLTAGYNQADGKPFVCHSVGVASIICAMGAPAKFVAFGLLHNVYHNGDFGEGLSSPLTSRKRDFVRERVGADVEELIIRFRDLRVDPSTIEAFEGRLSSFDETERLLVAADLADHMEKYVDRGVLFFGDGSWITDQMDTYGPRLIALAQRLQQPVLAEMMREAFAAVEGRPPMPDSLRPPKNRKYLALTLPLSARPRLFARIRTSIGRRFRRGAKRQGAMPRVPELRPSP
jgi:hypothetical protein